MSTQKTTLLLILLFLFTLGNAAIAEEYPFTAEEQAKIDKYVEKMGGNILGKISKEDSEEMDIEYARATSDEAFDGWGGGYSLLSSAIQNNEDIAVIQFLVFNGAGGLDSALCDAVVKENLEIVQFLVSKGAG